MAGSDKERYKKELAKWNQAVKEGEKVVKDNKKKLKDEKDTQRKKFFQKELESALELLEGAREEVYEYQKLYESAK